MQSPASKHNTITWPEAWFQPWESSHMPSREQRLTWTLACVWSCETSQSGVGEVSDTHVQVNTPYAIRRMRRCEVRPTAIVIRRCAMDNRQAQSPPSDPSLLHDWNTTRETSSESRPELYLHSICMNRCPTVVSTSYFLLNGKTLKSEDRPAYVGLAVYVARDACAYAKIQWYPD